MIQPGGGIVEDLDGVGALSDGGDVDLRARSRAAEIVGEIGSLAVFSYGLPDTVYSELQFKL